MPYPFSSVQKNELGDAMREYYDADWDAGVRGLLDKMARSNMGVVTGYLDKAKDTYANLKKESVDDFKKTFKADLKANLAFYLGNKNDVAAVFVTVGEKLLNKIADKFEIPLLSTLISFGADKAREELHERSIKEADKDLVAKSGSELEKLFVNDVDAQAYVTKAMDQYKDIVKYIKMMPTNISSFDDAITFPRSVFKVQKAASSLNVSILAVQSYLKAMQSRLEATQGKSREYIQKVRTEMPGMVEDVIQAAYTEGRNKGQADVGMGKFKGGVPAPEFARPKKPGGATQLAAYVSHAMALGYYEAGNSGPVLTRPRR
jgi:flagellar biosynthesis/type III secretory pathway protein FliH